MELYSKKLALISGCLVYLVINPALVQRSFPRHLTSKARELEELKSINENAH